MQPQFASSSLQLFQALADGATVFTASLRLSRRLRADYASWRTSRGDRAWSTPLVLPLETWVARQAAETGSPLVLDGLRRQIVWEQVLDRAGAHILLDLEATAQAAAATYELIRQWRVPLDDQSWYEQADCAEYLRWLRLYRQQLKDHRWLDAVALPDWIQRSEVEPPKAVLLAGFDELTTQQQGLIEWFRTRGCDVHTAPAERFGAGYATLRACKDAKTEARMAAAWVRQQLEANPEGKYAILAPSLADAIASIEHALLDALHPELWAGYETTGERAFNISQAMALSAYPPVSAALQILKACTGKIHLPLAGTLLRSPFVKGAATEAAKRAFVDQQIRGRLESAITATKLIQLSQELGATDFSWLLQDMQARFDAWPGKQRPSAWARSFDAVLRAAGWPGDRKANSTEYQVIERWKDALTELESLDTVLGEVTSNAALARLESLVEDPFQPETADAPVQVLGLQETAGMRFDAVWVMGLEDRVWPQPARPSSFIPWRLQREMNLPHATPQREADFARRTMRRLLSRAPRLTFSYPVWDGDRQCLPSPLIAEFPVDEESTPYVRTWRDELHESDRVQHLQDKHCNPIPSGQPAIGGARIFELQAQCPFRAFAELRLKAKPLEEPQPGLPPQKRGEMLHDTLKFFWQSVRSHERLLQLGGDLDQEITSAAAKAVEEFRRKGDWPEKLLAVERTRVEQIAAQWLDVESRRSPFTVAAEERAETKHFAGITFEMRIDRVDRLESDRKLVLIDYKSKAPALSGWEGDRPRYPQLPLYASVMSGELAAVAFANLKPGDVGFKGCAAAEEILPTVKPSKKVGWPAQLEGWRKACVGLAERFIAGRAEVDPLPQACEYCSMQPLCRVNEMEDLGLVHRVEEGAGE